jgi:hypothetical protein
MAFLARFSARGVPKTPFILFWWGGPCQKLFAKAARGTKHFFAVCFPPFVPFFTGFLAKGRQRKKKIETDVYLADGH